MTEHMFAPGGAPPPDHALLKAAILHHLLTRRPEGASASDLSRAVIAGLPAADRDALCATALAGLERDGLIARGGGVWSPTRAARAFHRLIIGGAP